MRRLQRGVSVVLATAGLIGCGAREVSQRKASPTPLATSEAVQPQATQVDVLPSTTTTTTPELPEFVIPERSEFAIPEGPDFVIVSELGRVSGRLPVDAGPDPIESSFGAPPDYVVGVKRWVVDACCRLTVVLQKLRPRLVDDDLIRTIEANGLSWNLYEMGPRDGTQIYAVTSVGDLTVGITGQTLFPSVPSAQVSVDIVADVVGTISINDA